MTATFNVWGNVGNSAYALPMSQLIPAIPASQGYILAWDIIEQALDYAPLSIDFSTGDASNAGNFNVAVGKVYKVNGVQVVGARSTGWAAATGTATRSTFDTATVTLPQLAQAMKALTDDLRTHGLIV